MLTTIPRGTAHAIERRGRNPLIRYRLWLGLPARTPARRRVSASSAAANGASCLDCEEVHDAQQCPICASGNVCLHHPLGAGSRAAGSAAPFISGWRLTAVPPSDRPRPRGRLLKQGVVGLTAVGLLGWLLRRPEPPQDAVARPRQPQEPALVNSAFLPTPKGVVPILRRISPRWCESGPLGVGGWKLEVD